MNYSVSGKLKSGVISVLGAGCAGLAAGLRLLKQGYSAVLIEKADHVGGLAGGVKINGNTYEYGPHAFHTTDPEILGDIKSLMGSDLTEYKRTIQIKFLGNYFQFPLAMRDVLCKLPPPTLIHAALSFVWHFVRQTIRRPAVQNSETVLKRYYGNVLYEIFFKSYITRVWGIPPSEFSPAFAYERIPRLNLFDVFDKISTLVKNRVNRQIKTENYVEKVEGNLYTTMQGFSLITQRMADKVVELNGQILLNAEVKRLFREGNQFYSVEFLKDGTSKQIECDGIISTLPINEAVRMISPALDDGPLQAARALRFRALVFVGVVVRRTHILPSSFMYFREHSFNRISDLLQFGFHVQPDGCTLLVAEISCDVSDRYWTDDTFAKEAILADLVAERLLERDEVVEMHVFRAEHAYPVYTLNYEQHRATLLKAIDATSNMETAGRQGRFQYINTHVAMKMGYEAADRLVAKLEAGR